MGAAAMSRATGAGEDEAERLRRAELEASYRTAGSLGFDELIDPREIRNVLLHALERALFRRQAAPEPVARVGILPGWGLSQKLPRLIGIHRAKELSLTGNFLSAQDAERWGLVNRVVSPEALLPTCRQLAKDMLGCEPATMRAYKKLIDQGFAETFGDGLRREIQASLDHVKSVSSQAIAERRKGIQERGRTQAG